MNLSDLRGLVGNLTNYNPDVAAYNSDIDKLINDTYMSIFSMHPWSFAQREETITAYGDVTMDVGVTSGSKVITSSTNSFLDWMEGGAIFEVGGTEWEIVQVATGGGTAYLATNFSGVTGTTSATIKHRFIDLPVDCIDVLQVGQVEYTTGTSHQGRFVPLSRYEGELFDLGYAQVGTPVAWLQADATTLRAPATAPTLLTNAGTAWPAGDYDILVGYRYQNRNSAPCATMRTYTSDGVAAVVPRITMPTTGTGSGYKRMVYVRPPGYTAFRTYATDQTEGALNYVMATAPTDGTWEFESRMSEAAGSFKRIRLSPRQGTDTTLTIRYLRRPSLLIEDQDTPAIPEPDQSIIAEASLCEVYLKSDQIPQSNVYRKQAEGSLARMEAKYLTQTPRRWVKQGWTNAVDGYRPYGTITHRGGA